MFSLLCCSFSQCEEEIDLSPEAYKASPEAIQNYRTALKYRERNGAEYTRFLRLAAKAGLVDAQVELGANLIDGIEVKKDREKARKWFVKAEAQGSKLAPQYLTRLAILSDDDELGATISQGDLIIFMN